MIWEEPPSLRWLFHIMWQPAGHDRWGQREETLRGGNDGDQLMDDNTFVMSYTPQTRTAKTGVVVIVLCETSSWQVVWFMMEWLWREKVSNMSLMRFHSATPERHPAFLFLNISGFNENCYRYDISYTYMQVHFLLAHLIFSHRLSFVIFDCLPSFNNVGVI